MLILRGLIGNWDLSKVSINSDETHELSCVVIILTGNQCFVVVLLQSRDRWREVRVWVLYQSLQFSNDPFFTNS